MKVICLWLALLPVVCSYAQASYKEQVEAYLLPFKEHSIEPSDTFAITSLKNALCGRHIVGVGQSVHGSSEFFKLKFTLFKFLVEQCGFRYFGLEESYSACLSINDYMVNGTGTNLQAVGQLSPVWRTTEMLDIIEWMRNYNIHKDDKDKIRFWGFDISFPETALYLSDFLDNHAGRNRKTFAFEKLLRVYNKENPRRVKNKTSTAERRDSVAVFADRVLLEQNELKTYIDSQLSGIFNADSVNNMQEVLTELEETVHLIRYRSDRRRYRDSCMANRIYRLGKDKGMISAHNTRILNLHYSAHNTSIIDLPHLDEMVYYERPSMGYFLKQLFGPEYYAIGADFGSGRFSVITPKRKGYSVNHLRSSAHDSRSSAHENINVSGDIRVGGNGVLPWPSFFSGLNSDCFFLDMHSSQTVDSLLAVSTGMRLFGERNSYMRVRLSSVFDGFMFVRTISPSDTIKRKTRKKRQS